MIEYRTGDIIAEDAEALVNTVNCVGVMGRGVALQFKNAFPENFKAYAAACKRGEVQPGRMFVFETSQLTNPHYIINFPTKRHWRGKSRISDIDAGLHALVSDIRRRGIRSVAIPPLGSGLGGLQWSGRTFEDRANLERSARCKGCDLRTSGIARCERDRHLTRGTKDDTGPRRACWSSTAVSCGAHGSVRNAPRSS